VLASVTHAMVDEIYLAFRGQLACRLMVVERALWRRHVEADGGYNFGIDMKLKREQVAGVG